MTARPARSGLRLAALAVLLAATAGCPPKRPTTLYAWGAYDEVLYAQAGSPQDIERYAERLGQVVSEAEATRGKAPPGLYAEYGYALFNLGRLDDAVTYYARERDTWPESVVLMEKMIRNTRRLREARPPSPRDGPPVPLPGFPVERPPQTERPQPGSGGTP